MQLNIDSSAVVTYTNTLEKMHRSALPVAIRGALNAAAFDVKKNTMPKKANIFVKRNPTFFKSTSKVQPATGFDIKTMKAVVGFMPQSGAKESGGATEDLKQQEDSGKIEHRAFIPLAGARSGGNYNRRVRNDVRLKKVRKELFNAKSSNLHGVKNYKEAFIVSSIYAGVGGFVLSQFRNSKGNRLVLRIKSINKKDGNTIIKSTPVYSVKGGRDVRVKATHFMSKASNESANKIEVAYIKEAKKQIERLSK